MLKAVDIKLRHQGRIDSVVVNLGAGIFATGSHSPHSIQNEVQIWELSTGRRVRQLQTAFNGILSLGCSRDGRYLAVGGGGYIVVGQKREHTKGIEVWDLKNSQRVARFGEELFFVKSLSFSPDDQLLLSTNYSPPGPRPHPKIPCVRLWSTSDFRQVTAFAEGEEPVQRACFSPDGEFVAFAHPSGPSMEIAMSPSEAQAMSPSRFELLVSEARQKKEADIRRGTDHLEPLIRTWSVSKATEKEPFAFYREMITGICFSSDGRLLGSSGSALSLWNFGSRSRIAELDDGSSKFNFTHCVAFSPDDRILVAGTGGQFEFASPYENCGIKVWDVTTKAFIAHLPHERPVYSLAFSQDGRKLVASGESELSIWDFDL